MTKSRMNDKKTESIISQSKERFINRRTSWLAFNNRVLDEAHNPATPLIERLNFLAISSSNLDEFYMIRVAGLKDYVQQGITKQSTDGLTPTQELEVISKLVAEMVERQHECWLNLRKELEKEEISIVRREDHLRRTIKKWLEEYFLENIFPVLTPIAIDPAHPFPFLPNLGLALVFQLNNGKEQIAIIPLPARLQRFIPLPGKESRYVMLEDAIDYFSAC